MRTAVAIALYNGARFIEKQLDSIRLQTQKPDCVVLCDDGSKDDTVEIVREYIRRYDLGDSWHLQINEKNLGYIRNFYGAIRLCDADLVFLSDQDDLWESDKIRRMAGVMTENPHLALLSCEYGIIDMQGNAIHSAVDRKAQADERVVPVSVQDILTAYRWSGMVMCLRKTFFAGIEEKIRDCSAAHDFMFAMLAADQGAFAEYHYVGAYHRRHDSNVAREEHRIFKLLNLERKLTDISVTKKLWQNFLAADLSVKEENMQLMRERLSLLEAREEALREKSLPGVLRLYRKDGGRMLRKTSLICDVWLVCFGKKKKDKQER